MNPIRMLERLNDRRWKRIEKALCNRHKVKASRVKEARARLAAAQAPAPAPGQPDMRIPERSWIQLQYNLDKAQADERKARLQIEKYRAKTSRRLASRARRWDRWREIWTNAKMRWRSLVDQFRTTTAEMRARTEESASQARGKGLLRKVRVLGIRALGYTTLAVTYVGLGVSAVLEGTATTLAAAGSLLLGTVSERLSRLWSGLWEALAWTAVLVVGLAFFLITIAVEAVVALLMLAVFLLVAPVEGVRRLIDKRRKVVVMPVPEGAPTGGATAASVLTTPVTA